MKSIIREVHMLKDRGVDLISHCHIRVGNGLRTQFWNEVWIGDTQLRVMFPRIYALEINKDCTVADKLQFSVTSSLRRSVRGGVESSQLALLQTYIEGTLLSNMEDRWVESSQLALLQTLANGYRQARYCQLMGTKGKVDQSCISWGIDDRIDVFPFGIVLFELLCGRSCLDANEHNHQLLHDKSTNHQWKNVVALKHLIPEEKKTHTLDLFKNMDTNISRNKKPFGKIVVEIMYRQIRKVNQGGGLLVVTIHEGYHLEQKNPIIYLQLRHGDSNTCVNKKQSMQAKNSKSPVWNNEKFEFIFDRQPTENILLYLHVHGSSWFQSYFGKNTFQIRVINRIGPPNFKRPRCYERMADFMYCLT
ncbi:RNA-directed DNA polymerase, eukaryota [Tanacetum coccineum]